MVKKTGLGKGLDALFSMPVVEDEKQREGDMLRNLKLIDVEPNRNQARKIFDQDSLQELAESIKQYGIIQPIVVTEKEGFYEIIAGERRWRAAKIAGLTEIPAIIRVNDEKKNKEISLIENVQREDLNPVDKAEGIKALMQDYSLTQEEIAKILGKSRSGIANSIRILNLCPDVLDLVRKGKLTEAHARNLLAIPEPNKQFVAALRIIENGEPVHSLEGKAKSRLKTKELNERNELLFRDIEDTFQGFFGTKVRIDAGKRSGKIVIPYKNNKELERILELLK